ncbi:hypothetical protein JCM10207_005937 [Rhodosporidiobolus poonsookiae]
MDLVPYIYHEQQEPGSMLCGQHALNNLLQSSLFTPQDLADIARQLDAMEAAQLDPGTRLRGEGESQNYDDSGFFSVQVMEEALKVLGLRLVRWGSKEMASVHNKPEAIEAFLLNHQLHWFAVRRFATPDRFYSLDSCQPAPTWVSATYLGMTLREAENQGYSIFAVLPTPDSALGALPPCSAADKALNLPPPRGSSSSSASSSNGYAAFGGNGQSVGAPTPGPSRANGWAGPSTSASARQPFSSALNPTLSFSSASTSASASSASSSARRNGKRPASPTTLDLAGSGSSPSGSSDDDDLVIVEDGSGFGAGGGGGGGKRRRMNGPTSGGGGGGGAASGAGAGMGEASEEEMMARAMRESLRVSGGGSAGTSANGEGSEAGRAPSRAAQSEEEEFQRAVAASLALASAQQPGQDGPAEVEVDEDEHAQEDSPTMEELRRRRMARFG